MKSILIAALLSVGLMTGCASGEPKVTGTVCLQFDDEYPLIDSKGVISGNLYFVYDDGSLYMVSGSAIQNSGEQSTWEQIAPVSCVVAVIDPDDR